MRIPPISMSASGIAAIAALGAGAFLLWKASKAVGAVGDAFNGALHSDVVQKDLNPASSDNIINRGVSKIGETVTGQQGWSLGTWLFDVTHPGAGYVDKPRTVSDPGLDLGGSDNGSGWD